MEKPASGEVSKLAFDGMIFHRMARCCQTGLVVNDGKSIICRLLTNQAAVAQLAEHHVANVIVEGSNPFSRSFPLDSIRSDFHPGATPDPHSFVQDRT